MYGKLTFQLEKILEEKHISKNTICKILDIPRTNLNRYCKGDFQRIDANMVCKILSFLEIGIEDLFLYEPPEKK